MSSADPDTLPASDFVGRVVKRRGFSAQSKRSNVVPDQTYRKYAMTDAVERALAEIAFGPDGLVTAVAQQYDSGEVLMVAWMNREAVRVTLAEGRVCYWSRSRQSRSEERR